MWSFIFISVLAASITAQNDNQPNIVFIITDDQGYYDVGYHGSEIKTPNLDTLAASGVRLENHYVQPLCSPSRSSLLSGNYPIHTGVQNPILRMETGLPLDFVLFPELLQDAGYSTHLVGKWHLGYWKDEYSPTSRGFDTFYGLHGTQFDYNTHNAGINCKDLHFNTREGNSIVETDGYSTFLFADRVREIVEKNEEKKPLYVQLAFNAPHTPLMAPQEYLDMYSFIQDEDRRTFAAMVTAMDDAVGDVVQTLIDNNIWDNTILIFTSDNGGTPNAGGYNMPLRGGKNSLWEGGIRSVAFVNSPLLEKPGITNTDLLHISDWYPTLVHLAGGNTTGMNLDGYDIWDTISTGSENPRKELLHNIDNDAAPRGDNLFPDVFDVRIRSSIRVGPWKLLTGNPGRGTWSQPEGYNYNPSDDNMARERRQDDTNNVFLFNVEEDPEERVNRWRQEPEVVQQLLQKLATYNATAVPQIDMPPATVTCRGTGNVNVPWG